MLEENILKLFFQLGEKNDKQFYRSWSTRDIIANRPFKLKQLLFGLKNLKSQGYIRKDAEQWKVTEAGKVKGQRLTKLHRLWELYLTEYLRIAPDHVHEDAETIEHIITPDLEARLEKLLKYPKLDPHQSEIPYNN